MLIIIILGIMFYLCMIGVATYTVAWHNKNIGTEKWKLDVSLYAFASIFWPLWFLPFLVYAIFYKANQEVNE